MNNDLYVSIGAYASALRRIQSSTEPQDIMDAIQISSLIVKAANKALELAVNKRAEAMKVLEVTDNPFEYRFA